ncbi:unnamed protein product [Cladocopium goreaui]|uniref:WWE domain-containing protein n=1 Tax=Cladocopium goreaui TaxID=2562237 RepID=A0A9P1D4V3_9DINO|nr:unnamed protein product [Cladocopium goreaui]
MAATGRTAADAEKVPEGGKASHGADGAGRSADGAAGSRAAVVWEFSVKDGFKAFDKECQELVETLHRAFLAGGNRVGHVPMGKQTILVDFIEAWILMDSWGASENARFP